MDNTKEGMMTKEYVDILARDQRAAFYALDQPDKFGYLSIQGESSGAQIGRVQQQFDEALSQLGWRHDDLPNPLYKITEYKGVPRLVIRPKVKPGTAIVPRVYIGDDQSPVEPENVEPSNGATADFMIRLSRYTYNGKDGVSMKPVAVRFHSLEAPDRAPDEEHITSMLFGEADGGF